MAQCQTAVSPVWRYCSLALSHRYIPGKIVFILKQAAALQRNDLQLHLSLFLVEALPPRSALSLAIISLRNLLYSHDIYSRHHLFNLYMGAR